jgi:hypothetical protein
MITAVPILKIPKMNAVVLLPASLAVFSPARLEAVT